MKETIFNYLFELKDEELEGISKEAKASKEMREGAAEMLNARVRAKEHAEKILTRA